MSYKLVSALTLCPQLQLVDAFEFGGSDPHWTTLEGGLQKLAIALKEVLQEKFSKYCKFSFNTRVVEVSAPDEKDKTVMLMGLSGHHIAMLVSCCSTCCCTSP